MEMLLTGVPLSAERAAQFGLVNQVVPPEQFAETLQRWAEQIATAILGPDHQVPPTQVPAVVAAAIVATTPVRKVLVKPSSRLTRAWR